jgi:hypothetical protein
MGIASVKVITRCESWLDHSEGLDEQGRQIMRFRFSTVEMLCSVSAGLP